MKKVGIIQARINSKRLPNKMFLKIGKLKILEWVIYRVLKSKLLDEVIVAIPDNAENYILERFLKDHNFNIFKGDQNDVLKRFFYAAKKSNADLIVRICADNPFIDHLVIDDLLRKFKFKQFDYLCNHQNKLNSGFADGFGAEILTFDSLFKLNKSAKSKSNREHVTQYIWENMNEFKIQVIKAQNELNFPKLRFDIDTKEDYEKMNEFVLKSNINIETSAIEIIKTYIKN